MKLFTVYVCHTSDPSLKLRIRTYNNMQAAQSHADFINSPDKRSKLEVLCATSAKVEAWNVGEIASTFNPVEDEYDERQGALNAVLAITMGGE